ncbi:MAG: hypothetical protein V1694_01570 [Candidatus Eisenbacteria bacterium]
MLKRYRPTEEITPWYLAEIKPKMDKLRNAKFTMNIVEEGEFPG